MDKKPPFYAFDEYCELERCSRSTAYRQAAEGKITLVKSGRRTLVVGDSARQHWAALPAFMPGQAA